METCRHGGSSRVCAAEKPDEYVQMKLSTWNTHLRMARDKDCKIEELEGKVKELEAALFDKMTQDQASRMARIGNAVLTMSIETYDLAPAHMRHEEACAWASGYSTAILKLRSIL